MTGPAELVTCDQTIERRIAYRKLGNYVRFHPDDLAEYVAAHRVEADSVAVGRRR
jgi:hypothetical protein